MSSTKELVIATNNAGKLREIKALLEGITILSLNDVGFNEEIPEPYETFEENAFTKAQTVHRFCGKNVLSDDSGLCVAALHDAPGVHSAYYGGEPRSDVKNNEKLLADLEGIGDRSAYYKAVLCLIWGGEPHYFTGICKGSISAAPLGQGGFGYDPLFVPEAYNQTFAELPFEVKNTLSHRAAAMRQLQKFIKAK